MATSLCPVCASSLDFEPWEGGLPSHEVCPFCGIQFGYNDARPELRETIYAEWRSEWIAGGRQPITGANWHRIAAAVAERAVAKHQTRAR